MTKIKLCGLSRPQDIEATNQLRPDYIGFVFAPQSRRYVSPRAAARLRRQLAPNIKAVGVFVQESPENAAALAAKGIIDLIQLHGNEPEDYIRRLRALTGAPIIKAFSMAGPQDVREAQASSADFILLDSGSGGTGKAFDWELIREIKRPYFLAGGLTVHSVAEAVKALSPYGVDVSSGIETDGKKDRQKMAAFVHAVRENERK